MKLDFLPDGSPDCPLVRLYDLAPGDASRLHDALTGLADGTLKSVPLQEWPQVEAVNNCSLALQVADRDEGIVAAEGERAFRCLLRRPSWQSVSELVSPFCSEARSRGYQWLDETSSVSWLLSTDGQW
jgi:hypothetical protein